MAYSMIKLEKKDLVGTLTLNRPEKMNALNTALLDEFGAALDEVAKDDEIRVLVIRGAGKGFSAGYDLSRSTTHVTIDVDRERLQRNLERWQEVRDLPKPVIAMVHGHCFAGATQLCICCDITFAAEDATIGFPTVPAGGGLLGQMWIWVVGPSRAKYMSFQAAAEITGKESEAFGWATKAFPASKLEEETYAFARRVAKVPAALLRIKKLSINRVMDLQGFGTATMYGAEWDSISHYTKAVQEVRDMIEQKGLRAAMEYYRGK